MEKAERGKDFLARPQYFWSLLGLYLSKRGYEQSQGNHNSQN
jgi:hypothetical protein